MPPLVRLARLGALLSLPALAAFAVLAATGALHPGPAALAAAAVLVVTALIARPLVANTGRFLRAVDALGEAPEAEPPAYTPSPFRAEFAEATQRVRQAFVARDAHVAELRAESQRLLDALPDALMILSRTRQVQRANRAARRLFGEQVTGRDLTAVLRHPALLAAVDAALAGEGGQRIEVGRVAATAQEYEATVEPLPVAGNGGPALLLALHDQTAMKRAEQMRVDFVANASHEIRSPLASIVGFVETLRGPAKGDAEAHERFLAIMAEQAARMTRLVEDLLSLSRIEMNEHTPPSGAVDVPRVLARVRDTLAWEARAREMRVELVPAPGLPPVRGDETELEQVFHNLIGNALKYGRKGTAVTLTATLVDGPPAGARWLARDARAVAVAVADVSDGIAREHIPRLTERFYRVDPARSRQLGGTGLGLAIVKHIVNRHRGALIIESTQGQGSTFTVYLPAAEPERAA